MTGSDARPGSVTAGPVALRSPRIVVMGVSGSGKSTVGARLAARLAIPFVEGDDLHSAANKIKMAAGHPLDDADRWPWLERVAEVLRKARGDGVVVACSALKKKYRDVILRRAPSTVFLQLDVPTPVLARRLTHRTGHFMPRALLKSQLAALEPLRPDEPGATLAANVAPDALVETAANLVASLSAAHIEFLR